MILYHRIEVEAQMERHQRIQYAHRVVGADRVDLLQVSIFKIVDAQALDFAHCVVTTPGIVSRRYKPRWRRAQYGPTEHFLSGNRQIAAHLASKALY